MSGPLLSPADVGPSDTQRILAFLNAVADADALAETVGFSDGLSAGRRVGVELIAARPFASLEQVLAVTGVGATRFNEIAVALSAARPPLAPDRLRFLSVGTRQWLGATIGITAQLTDADGNGITGRDITCVASDGVLRARLGLQIQAGSAIRLSPAPGGLISFTYGPRLWPRLDDAANAALTAELSRLDATARTPAEADKQISALAGRYRGQGAGALQSAIDRLFETYDAPIQSALAPWPVQPVTLLALTHDADGQVLQAASLTLELRNWLGAFYVALQKQVQGDRALPEALKFLESDAEKGLDLSRKIIQATQGYSALERGVLGRRLRDATTGGTVARFLDGASKTLSGTAIVNTVRAAGASEAAIASGGFAVFEAIRTVQEAGDSIKPPSKTGGLSRDDLLVFDQRLGTLESSTVTKGDFDRFRTTITSDVDQRFSGFEADAVKQSDLDRLRSRLTSEFDAKLGAFDDRSALDTRFTGLDARVKTVEDGAVSKVDMESLRTDLSQSFDTRIATAQADSASRGDLSGLEDRLKGLEGDATRKADLDRLRSDLTATVEARVADSQRNLVTTAALDARLQGVEAGAITRRDLDTLRTTITRDFDARLQSAGDSAETRERVDALEQRVRGVEAAGVTRSDLDRLRASISQDVDARLKEVADSTATGKQFEAIDARLTGLEKTAVDQADLEELRTDLGGAFDTRIATLESSTVSDAELLALKTEIDREISTRTAGLAARSDLDARIAALEADTATKLQTKANASTLTQIRTSLDKVSAEQTTLRSDLGKISTGSTGTRIRTDPTRR